MKRPIVFSKRKSKAKSNKRKQIELKNTYNIGFFVGFAVEKKEIVKRFHTGGPRKVLKRIKLPKKDTKKKKYLLQFLIRNYFYFYHCYLTKNTTLLKIKRCNYSRFMFLKMTKQVSRSHIFLIKEKQFLFNKIGPLPLYAS